MKELWRQRDKLAKENNDYEIKNQLLDEELRLVKKYKESLERDEEKLKYDLKEAIKKSNDKDTIIDTQKDEIQDLKQKLEASKRKYQTDIKEYNKALRTIKSLNIEIDSKNKELEDQTNLNSKFSEMLEKQNKKLDINESELSKISKKLK